MVAAQGLMAMAMCAVSSAFMLAPTPMSIPSTISRSARGTTRVPAARYATSSVSMSVAEEGHKFIIIGGGTAGCVLANRLSADKDNSVLVLEAGSEKFNDRNIKMPIAILRLFKSVFDWGFQSENEKFATGDGIYLCRGKVLGGSSCTNVMLYHRGEEADYDAWGVDGWKGKDVLPYFKKAENNRSKKKGEFHGKGGLMQVENARYMNPLTKLFFKACEQAGLSENEDFNDWSHSQEGFGRFQVAQKRGKRCSAASSYLKEAMGRKNLDVQTSAQITKVLIENGGAIGVEYVRDGEKKIAKLAVGGEILLAGGAISSPQVLMLSGVGPAEHLRSKGIEVKSNVPGVGKNLRDHPAVTVMADINKPISITDKVLKEGSGDVNKITALQWLLTGTGPLTSPGCENGAFFKTTPDKAAADLQLRFVPGRSTTPDGVKAYNTIGTKGRPPSGVTVQVVGIRPQSEGHVELRSSDPFDKPHIVTNYLESGEDMASLTNGIEMARKLFDQEAFGEMVDKEVFPGRDNKEISEYIKSTVHSANALVGTCKMGEESDNMSVVNSALKVKGVAGLRVIDSSVMPSIPGGQTAAPTIMIAEKAADMLMA
ncbi:conserved unknown protein [Ectocarpus siliculosus]|uniref:Glucose-methanol-choline oxidoreductase N-terminal domain-containing protein n=1 Tax=Ectocarpus siliculosus TaxID=2880 RepID=D7FW40_ECTSI|nr:conserved unknown protein [Ectocarpus siliculosus]|eukprot:CBJ25560.1 conserved unknown protein [Ectocarpus siliculosus]